LVSRFPFLLYLETNLFSIRKHVKISNGRDGSFAVQ
jgi:hypothetical protein